MSDRISDFITVIRNGYRARKESCLGRYSHIHLSIADILKRQGYIRDYSEITSENGQKAISITLKYVEDVPAVIEFNRWSKPGKRMYYGYADIPRVLGGLGTGILTTSKGIMIDRDARKQKIGGEMICTVW